MNEPIKAGDHCIVVGGMGGGKSPNLGKKVVVVSSQGEHSRYGRIMRCEGDGVQQLGDAGNYVTTGWGDFAVDWLEKIRPVKMDDSVTTEKEVAA